MRAIYRSVLFRMLMTWFCVLSMVGSSKMLSGQLGCSDIKCVDQKIEVSFDCSNDRMLVESLTLSEAEINLYIVAEGAPFSENRLRDVSVELLGDGNVQLSGTITLEMDGVENGRDLGLLKLLNGRSVDVQLVVAVEASDGLGVVKVEGAQVAGFKLPPEMVQQLITPDDFEGNELFVGDRGFELPCGVREMVVNDGDVVFVR